MEIYKRRFFESSLSRLYKHYQEHDSGTISAFRYARNCGDGELYSLSENKKRSSDLKNLLLAKGYGVTKISGVYIENYGSDNAIEVQEESYIVVDLKDSGKLKKDLIKFGKMFEQDSVTFSEKGGNYYLISSNECPNAYPGNGKIGKEIKLGKAMFGKSGEFHSKINGRPFVFEESSNRFEKLTDYSISEIRSIKALAEKINKEYINFSCNI